MSAYFQMGHDTENLVGEQDLSEFAGIVLSPVNRGPMELARHIAEFRAKGQFDIVFDPQLYCPNNIRGRLPEQPYFPDDLDTADLSSEAWWEARITSLVDFANELKVDAICSPAFLPRSWSDEYYDVCASVGGLLKEKLSTQNIRSLTTVLVKFETLAEADVSLRIASIISKDQSDGFYVVIESDVDPRRELGDPKALLGVMNLIQALRSTEKQILMSHCSSDMPLFKIAGATDCASGKFFNLRRFTKSRYEEEEEGGGGQLAYWFEQGLFAFLRQSDLKRLLDGGYASMMGVGYSKNYWSNEIIDQFTSSPAKAWVGLGWRQYLSWFGKTELYMDADGRAAEVKDWLRVAEQNWIMLEDNEILFEEPRNSGAWIRSWRQALIDFQKGMRSV
jgi:hypothetical protein